MPADDGREIELFRASNILLCSNIILRRGRQEVSDYSTFETYRHEGKRRDGSYKIDYRFGVTRYGTEIGEEQIAGSAKVARWAECPKGQNVGIKYREGTLEKDNQEVRVRRWGLEGETATINLIEEQPTEGGINAHYGIATATEPERTPGEQRLTGRREWVGPALRIGEWFGGERRVWSGRAAIEVVPNEGPWVSRHQRGEIALTLTGWQSLPEWGERDEQLPLYFGFQGHTFKVRDMALDTTAKFQNNIGTEAYWEGVFSGAQASEVAGIFQTGMAIGVFLGKEAEEGRSRR